MNVRRTKDGGASQADFRDKVRGRARRRGPTEERFCKSKIKKEGESFSVNVVYCFFASVRLMRSEFLPARSTELSVQWPTHC